MENKYTGKEEKEMNEMTKEFVDALNNDASIEENDLSNRRNIFRTIKGFFISLPIGLTIGAVFIFCIAIIVKITGWIFGLSALASVSKLLNDLLFVILSNKEAVLICFAVVIGGCMVFYKPTEK